MKNEAQVARPAGADDTIASPYAGLLLKPHAHRHVAEGKLSLGGRMSGEHETRVTHRNSRRWRPGVQLAHPRQPRPVTSRNSERTTGRGLGGTVKRPRHG